MQKNRPIPGHQQTSLCKKMGLFKLIGSFSHWTCRAHSRQWQFLSLDMLGPIAVIGSFLHAWEWAHSRTSTVSLIEHTGPIWAHWQFSSCVHMGPFKVISSFLREVNGPIWAHQQCSPCIGMGPFKVINSFSHWIYWAHSSSSGGFVHAWECVMFGLHFTTQIHQTASFPFLSSLTPKPMYNTIWSISLSMIQASGVLLYDINLGATHTTILSIRGVTIPIYLVSSTTDSIKQCIVLFKL